MDQVKIWTDPEPILRELDIGDVIKFYTEKEIISHMLTKNIVDAMDEDDLLDNIDNDKIEEHAKQIQSARE